MEKQVVSVGAGHGGFDFGTLGVVAEKDVTLFMQDTIVKRLEQTGRFEALRLRRTDGYVSTQHRVETVRGAGSTCHIELHVDLTPGQPKCTAVWHSADIPSDRAVAAELSRRLAKALGVVDCGARVRYDYCMLFKKMGGFEDYYAMIEALGAAGLDHVLYCECGIGALAVKEINAAAIKAANEIAQTVCELYGVSKLSGALASSGVVFSSAVDNKPVLLRDGYFNLRAGPGAPYPITKTIEGLIFTAYEEEVHGWLRLATGKPEYISAAAVDAYLNLQPGVTPTERFLIEKTGHDGFYFVLAGAEPGSEILGAVGTSTTFCTVPNANSRRVFYCDRQGFISASAFEAKEEKGRR